MTFLQLKDSDIFIIDYAGTINLKTGLFNMKIIECKLCNLAANRKYLKIIFDIRNTFWENRETHDTLSKMARKIFRPDNFNAFIQIAILNNEIEGSSFENEHWFINEKDAIQWLTEI